MPSSHYRFIHEIFLPAFLKKLNRTDELQAIEKKLDMADYNIHGYREERSFYDSALGIINLRLDALDSIATIGEEVSHYLKTYYSANDIIHDGCVILFNKITHKHEVERTYLGGYTSLDLVMLITDTVIKRLKGTLKRDMRHKEGNMLRDVERHLAERLMIVRRDAESMINEYYGGLGHLIAGETLEEIGREIPPGYEDAFSHHYSIYQNRRRLASPFDTVVETNKSLRKVSALYTEEASAKKDIDEIKCLLDERAKVIEDNLKNNSTKPDKTEIKKRIDDDAVYNEIYLTLAGISKKHKDKLSESWGVMQYLRTGALSIEPIDIHKDIGHKIGYLAACRAFTDRGDNAFDIDKKELEELIVDTYKRAREAEGYVNKRILKLKEEIKHIQPVLKNLIDTSDTAEKLYLDTSGEFYNLKRKHTNKIFNSICAEN